MKATASIRSSRHEALGQAEAGLEHVAECARGQPRIGHRRAHLLGHQGARARVRGVALDHHRAAGGQRRRGVAAGGAEGQREVGRAEDRDRSDRDEHAAHVGTGDRSGVGVSRVDDDLQVITGDDHVGEHLELDCGALELAAQAGLGQSGLIAAARDDLVFAVA